MNHEFLLYGPIGSDGVTAGALAEFLRAAGAEPVTIRVNSAGGDAFEGLAMHALVRDHGNVTARIDGLCASAATFVAFAAKRVAIAKEAMLMIHAPRSIMQGTAESLRSQADLLDKVSAQIAEIYARRSGKKVDEVSDWLKADTWFTAEEAKKAGLVDEVIDAPAEPFNYAFAWRFRSPPAAVAAKLEPVGASAEIARLRSELDAARRDAATARMEKELAGYVVGLDDEARSALIDIFMTSPDRGRALVSQFRKQPAKERQPETIILGDVHLSAHARGGGSPSGFGAAYDAHMSRLNALRS